MFARAALVYVLYLLLLKKNALAPHKVRRRESEGTRTMTASKSEKSLWLIGSNGEVHVGDEAALACEVKRTLEGKDLSRRFMTACADMFFKALGDEYAFVPEGELARTMGAAARIHVLTALANEVAASMEGDDEMREVEAASAWLAGALTRSVGSLVERARQIGSAPVPEAVATAWAVGKVLTGQYIRTVSNM